MVIEPYSSCPCGSGKKFRWCCQDIHAQIGQALQQEELGQHEVALRLMEEIVQAHPTNSEAWGRKAQLLYQNQHGEEAEAALQKAFDLNPKYAFGHFLKGMFRYHEGEIPGALLLFRKAAENYDPEAVEILGHVYDYIGDCEMKLGRPVAARASLQQVLRSQPPNSEGHQQFDRVFGEQSALPPVARLEYAFRSPAADATEERRTRWSSTLPSGPHVRLIEAARGFEQLTQADQNDAPAWYNLGLARAWLGDNVAALEALDRYVSLEPDEVAAGEAWALGEVLRLGAGMESHCDHLEYSIAYQIRDGAPISKVVNDWIASGRLVILQHDQEQGTFSSILLEVPQVLSAAAQRIDAAPFGAYFQIFQNVVRLAGTIPDRLQRLRAELEQHVGASIVPSRERISPARFGEVVTEAVLFPGSHLPPEDAKRRVDEHVEKHYLGPWLGRRLISLNGHTPTDATASPTLRKKLRGVILFHEQCAMNGALGGYDFDRVRQKLGLTSRPLPTAAAPSADINDLDSSQLAALAVDSLTETQLEQAWQSAVRLEAHDAGQRFAQSLVARSQQPDRFPWHSYLIQRALTENRLDEALDRVNEGEQADCTHNEGHRRNDYELRRAQVHTRRGEADAAADVFERLIQRDPDNMKARTSAVEAMLTLKQGSRAQRYVEEGLAQSRKLKDRDSEGHLMELAAAARKLS